MPLPLVRPSAHRSAHGFQNSSVIHRQCLLDQAADMVTSLKCPSCETYLPTNAASSSSSTPAGPLSEAAILTRYHNEGGLQSDLDILPTVREEAYLAANPGAIYARALHVMAGAGDVVGIVDLVLEMGQGISEDDPTQLVGLTDLLDYRDPLSGGRSALHVAVERSRPEVAWLLLWLMSQLAEEDFPPGGLQSATAVGLSRIPIRKDQDIRSLRNDAGQTAGEVARQLGGMWLPIVEAGILGP